MKIEELDTSEFIFDPKTKRFVERMEKVPAFKLAIPKLTSKRDVKGLLTYITLMYDKKSELRNIIRELPARKREAAIISGFYVFEDGSFRTEVEECLLGQNSKFNTAVMSYITLAFNRDYQAYIVYEDQYFKLQLELMQQHSKSNTEFYGNLRKDLEKLEDLVFGGREVKNMRDAMYASVRAKDQNLMPEDIVKKFKEDGLHDWSPYGVPYRVSNLKFTSEKK